jgi:hypothetical protein
MIKKRDLPQGKSLFLFVYDRFCSSYIKQTAGLKS